MCIRVLLVDDAKDFIRYMCERLSNEGMEVSVAYCGEEALNIIETQNFHVVVLDTIMPGLGGLETLQEIIARNVQTKVIMLTGNVSVVEAVTALKMGAADLLLKPCDAKTLVNSIHSVHRPNTIEH